MLKRRILKVSAGMFITLAAGLGIYHIQTNVDALKANQYTCQPNGTYALATTGPAAITDDDQARSVQALAWLESMTNTKTVVTTASTLAPSMAYAPTHTGPISGTFTLTGATYPIKNDASIEITSPATVPDNYAGVIQGKVLVTPTLNRWIIQVYKRTAGGDVQVAKQALADASTGEFTIDLSDVVSPPTGKWAFGILDSTAGYAEYGTKWPSPMYYDGLEVQQKLVTDGIYDWSTTRALADNTFTFPNSNTGKKLFRLVDTASGDILAEEVEKTGLIRSFKVDDVSDPAYGTAFENQSYVYDQAVALFAAIGVDDQELADTLAEGLLHMQQASGPYSGGFVFAAPQLSPTFRDTLIRTGAHAIATDALLSYIEKYPTVDDVQTYRAAAESALVFIGGALSTSGTTSGLYLGGYGDYSGPSNSFDGSVVIPWASTEHNLDIWHAFVKAARVLGNNDVNYIQKASTLNIAIVNKLYSTVENRFYQGVQPGDTDTADPLDVNSWGAMQLYSSGQYDEALLALDRLAAFKVTSGGVTGYAPFYDSAGYPGAVPSVWFEGSYGAALALYQVGDYQTYRSLLSTLADGQESDGSFRYATDEDPVYSITTRKSVASTAWFILATTGRSAIWNICQYNPPVDPIEDPETPVVAQPKPNTTQKPAPVTGMGADSNNAIPEEAIPTEESENVVPDEAISAGRDEPSQEESSVPFDWTPVVVIVSGIVGLGAILGAIGFIRSRSDI